uniref:Acyltransferase n=1 Tax=uncultured microorganism TaxID=358574 RepID=K0J799_9ZZZZ|nr:acyltransferase [uncultured microorganism]
MGAIWAIVSTDKRIPALSRHPHLRPHQPISVSLGTIIKQNAVAYEPGHLWFLQLLLLFAVIYVIFRALAESAPNDSLQLYRDRFPPDAILFLTIAVLAVLTFAVRLVFPVGEWFLRIQPGHFVHYAFCFFVGMLAYRGDWLRRLSKAQARRWGIMSLVAIPLFFPVVILGGVLESEENMAKLMGGLHWQALVVAAWDTFLMVGITVFLLYFFRERLNQAGPMAKSMAGSVYTVYIIHQPILIALNILMLHVGIGSQSRCLSKPSSLRKNQKHCAPIVSIPLIRSEHLSPSPTAPAPPPAPSRPPRRGPPPRLGPLQRVVRQKEDSPPPRYSRIMTSSILLRSLEWIECGLFAGMSRT